MCFTIEAMKISEEELVEYLKRQVDKKWPWQLTKLEEYSYLIRFPPNKKVESNVMNKGTSTWMKG